MNRAEFLKKYLCEWAPDPDAEYLHELAKRYYAETEAYDRTVCSGHISRNGIMPATPQEMGLINRNAKKVFGALSLEAWKHGIQQPGARLHEAMRRIHAKSP